MSAFILITGTLFRDPEQRTSKNGKPFVTATLRVKDGNESQRRQLVLQRPQIFNRGTR
ncbi:MAG: hypothetical protein WA231_24025 [Methylocella sp.]|jgi:hypothetical protein